MNENVASYNTGGPVNILNNTVEDRAGKSVSDSNKTPQEAINHTCEQVKRDNLSTICMYYDVQVNIHDLHVIIHAR